MHDQRLSAFRHGQRLLIVLEDAALGKELERGALEELRAVDERGAQIGGPSATLEHHHHGLSPQGAYLDIHDTIDGGVSHRAVLACDEVRVGEVLGFEIDPSNTKQD